MCRPNRRLFSRDETLELESYYMLYRSSYNRLAAEAVEWRVCRWPVRPKCHYYEHLIYDVRGLDARAFNGRFFANFQNEDWIRRSKQLALKCHQAHLSAHITFKYILQCTLQWR